MYCPRIHRLPFNSFCILILGNFALDGGETSTRVVACNDHIFVVEQKNVQSSPKCILNSVFQLKKTFSPFILRDQL